MVGAPFQSSMVLSVMEMLCVTQQGAGLCPHPAATLGTAKGNVGGGERGFAREIKLKS